MNKKSTLKRRVSRKNASTITLIDNGIKQWRNKKGVFHRKNAPAVEYNNGNKEWYINGQLHREDGPAIIMVNGDKEWWVNGHKHREDGPAVEYVNGHKEWWVNGQLHRLDGPAVEWVNGYKEWWLNGKYYSSETEWKKAKQQLGLNNIRDYEESRMTVDISGHKIWTNKQGQLHRRNGPAVEYTNGCKTWYINGQLHREDGPAVNYVSGYKEWWLNGKYYPNEAEWEKARRSMLKNKYRSWKNRSLALLSKWIFKSNIQSSKNYVSCLQMRLKEDLYLCTPRIDNAQITVDQKQFILRSRGLLIGKRHQKLSFNIQTQTWELYSKPLKRYVTIQKDYIESY